MSTEIVEIVVVPADAPQTARKLLEAAGDNPRAVRTGGLGAFYVPEDVATAAGLGAVEQATDTPAQQVAAKRGNAKTEQAG